MALSEEELEALLLGSTRRPRFTQDSPVYPDVWIAYLNKPADHREDLLLEPHYEAPVGSLAKAVTDRLGRYSGEYRMAWAAEHVAVELTLRELLGAVLPLSSWWRDLTQPGQIGVFGHLEAFAEGDTLAPDAGEAVQEVPPPRDQLEWWIAVAGRTLTDTSAAEAESLGLSDLRRLTAVVLDALGHPRDVDFRVPPLWSVSRNRVVKATLWRSRQAVKADAAARVFPPDLEGLAWGVVDSGIDARHPAFQRRDAREQIPAALNDDFRTQTIVRRSWDFTKLRQLITTALLGGDAFGPEATALKEALASGLAIDWGTYEPLIRVQHRGDYAAPVDPHGTHVAGIIAGDWRTDDPGTPPRHALQGVCPGLALYDLRVLDDFGEGDEFSVLAALSFVRWRNSQSGGFVIHGVNLSFALEHDVRNSACGRSPVCLEVERVHNSGVVVVVAAGNDGRADYSLRGESRSEGYRTASIADPGNAQDAITVGSTHRIEPHAYGVSYFSSRGPTGDGRSKPDLVAPGEKITAPIPGEKSARMDGTSMAAPHVSGAAALLMARHRELVGEPDRVKWVLCNSATDLGRERHYQGAGLLDVFRAIQSV